MSAGTDTRPNVEYGSGEIAMDNEILRSVVGSGVHGIAIAGTDDHDEMGIFIEPMEMVVGIQSWDYPRNRLADGGDGQGMPNFTWRTQPEGARSGPGDVDLVMYSLRKYLRLAAKGNPTALLPLYAPEADLLITSDLGMMLRGMRTSFLSQRAIHRFLGYMEAQHERMLGGGKKNRVPNRPELVEKYGFDTKYASHALRLAIQGHELTFQGHLSLPLPPEKRDAVLDVKQGHVSQEEVSSRITTLAAEIQAALDEGKTALPPEPRWEQINQFSKDAHLAHWGAI